MKVSTLTVFLFAAAASAQNVQPTFEVASIRPAPCPCRVMVGFDASGPNLNLEAYPWGELVVEAFGLKRYQVTIPDAVAKALDPSYPGQGRGRGVAHQSRVPFDASGLAGFQVPSEIPSRDAGDACVRLGRRQGWHQIQA